MSSCEDGVNCLSTLGSLHVTFKQRNTTFKPLSGPLRGMVSAGTILDAHRGCALNRLLVARLSARTFERETFDNLLRESGCAFEGELG